MHLNAFSSKNDLKSAKTRHFALKTRQFALETRLMHIIVFIAMKILGNVQTP